MAAIFLQTTVKERTMKTKGLFLKPAWAALALALMFTACSSPTGNGDDEADKTTLYTTITLASMTKAGVAVSVDGLDVAAGAKWVTAETKNTLDAAISQAQEVAGDASATQTRVNNMVSALTNAIAAFNSARQDGIKTTGFNQSEFDTLKAAATAAKTGALVSTNGSDVPVTGIWVSQTAMDTFNAAIITADGVATVNDAAYLALSNALAVFNAAKQPGSGGKGNNAFEGTWANDFLRLEASNGSFKQYLVSGNKEVARGTYTVSGNTVTARLTEINTVMFDDADKWFTWANLPDEYKESVAEMQQITINGNTFTSNGQTFIKQNGTDDGNNNGGTNNSPKRIGQISGSITLTDIPTPRPTVNIHPYIYVGGNEYRLYCAIDLSKTSGSSVTVNWTLPIDKDDDNSDVWAGLTGIHEVTFTADWKPPESNYYRFSNHLRSVSLDMTNKDNIDAGHLGTTSLATITLSGTITYSGGPAPAQVDIAAYSQAEGTYLGIIHEEINSPASGASWSAIIRALNSPTTIVFRVSDSDFYKYDLTPTTVYNTDVSGIVLDLGDITPFLNNSVP
jgi:hypothetical protein